MIDKQQIEQEAEKHYIKGSASYYAFIYGAEWALKGNDNEQKETDP